MSILLNLLSTATLAVVSGTSSGTADHAAISADAATEEPSESSSASEDAPAARKPGTWRVPEVLRPGTRPHVLELGIGPYGRWFGAEVSYLYHFSGGPTGPAIGGVVSTSASWYGRGALFSVGGKFEWDFQLFKNQPLGLYLGPFATVNYQHRAAVRMDVGAHARLMLNDRWCVFVQPAVLSMYILPDRDFYGRGFWATYHAAFGGGVTF